LLQTWVLSNPTHEVFDERPNLINKIAIDFSTKIFEGRGSTWQPTLDYGGETQFEKTNIQFTLARFVRGFLAFFKGAIIRPPANFLYQIRTRMQPSPLLFASKGRIPIGMILVKQSSKRITHASQLPENRPAHYAAL
jgi:hypothetical protein